MSGIVALLRLDGAPASALVVDAMLAAQAHRGPDAQATRVVGPIGLGHCLLVTTAEDELVRQPLRDRHHDRFIVADARLDNRDDLFALGLAGEEAPADVSDAALLLAAYDRWGDACVEHLVGDFAFALWDGPRRRLFCARDPLGVRQLYYQRDARAFRCASEMQPLFADPAVVKRPHRVSVGLFLVYEYNERAQTLYEEIFALPPGHRLVVSDERFSTERYWRPDPWRQTVLPARDHAERFCAVFAEAVRCRLRSSRPLASHVSGGVDSASVAGMAEMLRRQTPQLTPSIELVTLAHPGLACDEAAFSQTVAERWNLALTVADATNASYTDPLRTGRYADTYYRPTVTSFAALLDVTRAHGVRTTLTGFGADQSMHRADLAHFGDCMRRGNLAHARGVFHPGDARSFATLARVTASAFLPASVRERLPRGRRFRAAMPRWMSPRLASEVAEHLAERQRGLAKVAYPSLVSRHYCEWLTHSREVPLAFGVYDRLAARDGNEFRYPFFDVRLVELLLSFPQEVKAGVGAGLSKPLLREAMRGVLPEAIRGRGEGAELTAFLEKTFEDHAETFRNYESPETSLLLEQGFLAPARVRASTRASAATSPLSGVSDVSGVRDVPHVSDMRHTRHTSVDERVAILGMEHWLREASALRSS